MPIGGIALFWLVHVLPEKIAEKRHHPQKDAIQVLCLLSLVFGGLLWPLAWLWAYSKPVLHKLAYGRDKHDDYYAELEPRPAIDAGETRRARGLGRLRQELERSRSAATCPSDEGRRASAWRDSRAAPPVQPRPGETADGSPAAGHLLVLRLADLLQVQVAAVEHASQVTVVIIPIVGAHRADPVAERRTRRRRRTCG